MVDPIQIDGLKEFSKNLRKLDSDLPKALRLALNDAADMITDDARPRIPRRSGRASRTLKSKSTRTEVRIQAGSKRVAYWGWLEFGGAVGRKRSVRRAFLKEGRYVYASYFRKRNEFAKLLIASLVSVAAQAGVEVDG